ncbi:MAG: hypothetical protein WCA20_02475 [Candidatus Sulfotelmatobacter sp.]
MHAVDSTVATDPQGGQDGNDGNHLPFSMGRDLRLNPPQQDKPLNYFVYPYADVDGDIRTWPWPSRSPTRGHRRHATARARFCLAGK